MRAAAAMVVQWWAWQMATAKASAASVVSTAHPGSSVLTISWICCVAACPVEAIHADHDVPEGQEKWIEINATAEEFPVIEAAKDPLKGPKCVNPNAA